MPDEWRLTAFGCGPLQSFANAISAARTNLASYLCFSPLSCRGTETTKKSHPVFATLDPQHISDTCVPNGKPKTSGCHRRPIFTQATLRFSGSHKL
jgi:hypothetical protein